MQRHAIITDGKNAFFSSLSHYHSGNFDVTLSCRGNEASRLLGGHHMPVSIDNGHSLIVTSEFEDNDVENLSPGSPPEAVLWRRGQLLGRGAFGSVWLALREKVSASNS